MDREWLNSLASPLEAFRDLYLVPGGRWLLGFRPDGEVFYYDLESPNYEEKRVLVPAYTKDAGNNDVEISIDIAERLPIRSFKVVQYIDEHGPAGSTKYKGINVWEVTFVFEGKRVAGLKAICLKTIPVDPACDTSMVSISLRNEHFAIAGQHSYPILRQRLQCIYILEWLHIVDGSLDYSRRVLYVDEAQEITEIHLLPNNRVFALSSPWAFVYDFSSLQYTGRTPELHPDHSTLTPPPSVSQHCVHILSTLYSPQLHAIAVPDNLDGTGSSSHLVVKPLIPLPLYEMRKE
ncbi:hypothetical protein D9613_000037 [Agrocybe pediades]|uniref:Uncharacterized protein n=1 Tax=Agrocybe pediades TaxID=84607 RepID=A0A8H4R106_9AGAR|nr:hypothetical protein D9613_000037 [Agrocybe pediades]